VKDLNRKKILTVCVCFWATILVLAANFRLASYNRMTSRSVIHTDNKLPLSAARPDSLSTRSTSSGEILKQWQEWRGRPSGWTANDKAEFFKNNCQHIIESGRTQLKDIHNAGSQL